MMVLFDASVTHDSSGSCAVRMRKELKTLVSEESSILLLLDERLALDDEANVDWLLISTQTNTKLYHSSIHIRFLLADHLAIMCTLCLKYIPVRCKTVRCCKTVRFFGLDFLTFPTVEVGISVE
jgi:hypothetical protein